MKADVVFPVADQRSAESARTSQPQEPIAISKADTGKWSCPCEFGSGEELECEVCKSINLQLSKINWTYEWILRLKDWCESLEYTKGCHQMKFDWGGQHIHNEIEHLRKILGTLQAATPSWMILDCIKENACILARKISHELEMQKLWHDIEMDEIERERGNEQKLRTIQRLKKIEDIGKSLKARMQEISVGKDGNSVHRSDDNERSSRRPEEKKYKEILTHYVQYHVFEMLQKSYEGLEKAEEKLKPKVVDLPALAWFKILIGEKLEDYSNRLTGPVGERPLHTCSLSAYRFPDVDFHGHGNYVRDGIIRAMQMYMRKEKGKDGQNNQLRVAYGKDYIALVGSYIQDMGSGENHQWHKNPNNAPPFWSTLVKWNIKNHGKELRLCPWPKYLEPSELMKESTVLGLYEGETIVFPMIAAGDAESLAWVFKFEIETQKKSSETGFKMTEKTLKGLFFQPMHTQNLTSFSVETGWHYYFDAKRRETNLQASSPRSYFGLSMLAFSASQDNVTIFDMIFDLVTQQVEEPDLKRKTTVGEPTTASGNIDGFLNNSSLQKAILNQQDKYGNTLLHIAAWNEIPRMYDHLIELGADPKIRNFDGLTPFLTTARFGIWSMFNHIWDRHMTLTLWKFGNVERAVISMNEIDWRGPEAFSKRTHMDKCMTVLVNQFNELSKKFSLGALLGEISKKIESQSNSLNDLERKFLAVSAKVEGANKEENFKTLIRDYVNTSGKVVPSDRVTIKVDESGTDQKARGDDGLGDALVAIRVITVFRPRDWYDQTKEKIENAVLKKWAQGYHLMHIGQTIIPYTIILVLFVMMWIYRQLNVLEHKFWWANEEAVLQLKAHNFEHILTNPVVANVSELKKSLESWTFGTAPSQLGLLPDEILGPESKCGWKSIAYSQSGALQATLIIYAVPSLLRLAYVQRRIRPSDLDENEDMKISIEELVNFIYFNLESILHIVIACLFVTIGAARVAAGEQCNTSQVHMEKNATAIAGMFLFLNLFVVFKPYKGMGLLVLTIYRFLLSDVFNFLLMYSLFFIAFLLALQTLHRSNHVYLAWMDITKSIAPQVNNLTGMSYLVNANIPSNVEQMQGTYMALDGCKATRQRMQDTAFSLLEISFGDGLADALEQSRRMDYECAGFTPAGLTGWILVFWVFLTNVLVLNMLIAMMNFTFDSQMKRVHSVWLLDVSYRIMRYERIFPELVVRLQRPVVSYSIWRRKFWQRFVSDVLLALYCIPEVHFWGYGQVGYVWITRNVVQLMKTIFSSKDENGAGEDELNSELKKAINKSVGNVKDVEKIKADARNSEGRDSKFARVSGLMKSVKSVKANLASHRLDKLANHHAVTEEVTEWTKELKEAARQASLGDSVDDIFLDEYLFLVSLIHRLIVIQQSFDESHSLAVTRPWKNRGNDHASNYRSKVNTADSTASDKNE